MLGGALKLQSEMYNMSRERGVVGGKKKGKWGEQYQRQFFHSDNSNGDTPIQETPRVRGPSLFV